jgi:hypothetical protein
VIEAVGWVGAVAVQLAYGLNHLGRLHPRDPGYLVLNTVGAIGLMISTAVAHAWPSAVVNLIWLVIGVPQIVASVRLRRPAPPTGLPKSGRRSGNSVGEAAQVS